MSFNIADITDPTSIAMDDILGKPFVFKGEFMILFEYQKKSLHPTFNRLPIVIMDEEHKSIFKQLYTHATGRSPANPIGSLNNYTNINILGKAAKSISDLKPYVSSFPGSIIINGGFVVEFIKIAKDDSIAMKIIAIKVEGSSNVVKKVDYMSLLD